MSILGDHHIIPRQFAGHPAFKGIDERIFGIEAPGNRIYLPVDYQLAISMGISAHPGGHVPLYYKAVKAALDRIAQNSDPSIRSVKIKTLVDAMRTGLANGDLHTNVPPGMSLEEVKQGITKVVENNETYLEPDPESREIIRGSEQKGFESGQDHLQQWFAILGHPTRERLLSEAIKNNPGVNVTSGNRNLDGTPYSKFAAIDPSSDILRIPGSSSINPSDFPLLPGYRPPSLGGVNEPEGFTRSDPRFTGVLPAFPVLSPNEKRLGQLPPTTSTPSDPLVLKFDPASGAPLPFSERSPILDPDPPSAGTPPNSLYGVAGLAALMAIAPEFWPIWGMLGTGLVGTASARAAGAEGGAGSTAGGVFSTGTTPYNAFASGNPAPQTNGNNPLGQTPGSPAEDKRLEPERDSTFADRFRNWTDTAVGTMPAQDVQQAPSAPVAGAVPPEEVRRLTRVNATNASSVFTSGSAPVPYLPSSEFNDRFGSWSMLTREGGPEASKPIGAFADEPSYFVPPPIFGADDSGSPRNDAEAWFSRWIQPFLRSE